MSELVSRIIREGVARTMAGEQRRITGGVSAAEAEVMAALIRENGLSRTLETGVAFGVSTLAICEALSALPNGGGAVHYGIDPYQTSEHGGAALRLLKDYGMDRPFRLLENPTHIAAPKLIETNEQIDFAFIDGYHTFDYTLIDVFMIDKLLRPGGYLAMHDILFASKKKVLRFLLGHRRYRVVSVPSLRPSLAHRGVSMLRSIKHGDSRWYSQPARGANLMLLQKTEQFEPEWHYFKDF